MLTQKEMALIMTVLELLGKPATCQKIHLTFKAMEDQLQSATTNAAPKEFVPTLADFDRL
jgi:hypothetical protein